MPRSRPIRRLATLALLGAASLAPRPAPAQEASAPAGDAGYTVEFLGRTIDLRPWFEGFPYSGWTADFDAGRLFYFHDTPEGRFLLTQPLADGPVDPEAGRRLHDVDWSRRNFWGMEYDSVRGDMIVAGDERNDEVVNLYRLDLDDG